MRVVECSNDTHSDECHRWTVQTSNTTDSPTTGTPPHTVHWTTRIRLRTTHGRWRTPNNRKFGQDVGR